MIEIQANTSFDENYLRQLLLDFEDNENPLIIRQGFPHFDKAGWEDFLINKCGFQFDDRQFDEKSHYKSLWWTIAYHVEKEKEMYAFSKKRHPFHTDNAWFPDPAEINFFIMEKQAAEGGEQTIYRISRLLNDLEKYDVSLLNDLMNSPVIIRKEDKSGTYFEHHTTIIQLGKSARIFWNYFRTEMNDPAVKKMCDAFFDFLQMHQLSNAVEKIYLNAGDCLAFNDAKLLHGRLSFSAGVTNDRILHQSMWRYPDSISA